MRALTLFVQFQRLNLRAIAQYRLNLVVWFVFGIAYNGASIGVLWAMLQRFPLLNGWTFRDLLFLYALWSLGHGVYSATLGKVSAVSRYIREGRFDRFLVRPLGALFQVITVPEGITIDDFFFGSALFALAQAEVHLVWTPERALLLAAVIVGAALIKGALLLALSTLSFWLVRMDAARILLETLELEFIRFPLTIFPRAAQWLLTFVMPLAFVSFLPAELFLAKSAAGTLLNPAWGQLTPFVGGAAFTLSYLFWRTGLLHYQGTGS